MNITADVRALYQMEPEETKKFTDWMWEWRERTHFDLSVMRYPRAAMFSAADSKGTTLFLPAHPVLMFESLCMRPGLNEKEAALSMWRIGEVADQVMRDVGMCETYFITNSKELADATEKRGCTKCLYDAEKGQWLMKRRISEAPKHEN